MISGKEKMAPTGREKAAGAFAAFTSFIFKLLVIVIIVFVLLFPLRKYESEDMLILVNPISKEARVFELDKTDSVNYNIKKITHCKMSKITENGNAYFAIPLNNSLVAYYETLSMESFDSIFVESRFGFWNCVKVYFFGETTIEP